MKTLLRHARHYSKSLLGIMVIMILLVYSYLTLAIAFLERLGEMNQTLLIVFSILFPFFLFGGLLWIVVKRPGLLFSEKVYVHLLVVLNSIIQKFQYSNGGSRYNAKTEKETKEDLYEFIEQVMKCMNEPRKNKRILWVDDNPDNNVYECIALKELGFRIEHAISTEEALTMVHKNYAAIISDMKRKEGDDEGYVLYRKIREKHIYIPYFVYTGYCTSAMKNEAGRAGLDGFTNDPKELIDMITECVVC